MNRESACAITAIGSRVVRNCGFEPIKVNLKVAHFLCDPHSERKEEEKKKVHTALIIARRGGALLCVCVCIFAI